MINGKEESKIVILEQARSKLYIKKRGGICVNRVLNVAMIKT